MLQFLLSVMKKKAHDRNYRVKGRFNIAAAAASFKGENTSTILLS